MKWIMNDLRALVTIAMAYTVVNVVIWEDSFAVSIPLDVLYWRSIGIQVSD